MKRGELLVLGAFVFWALTRNKNAPSGGAPSPTESAPLKNYTDPNGHEWAITMDSVKGRFVGRALTGWYAGETFTKPIGIGGVGYAELVAYLERYAKDNPTPP